MKQGCVQVALTQGTAEPKKVMSHQHSSHTEPSQTLTWTDQHNKQIEEDIFMHVLFLDNSVIIVIKV